MDKKNQFLVFEQIKQEADMKSDSLVCIWPLSRVLTAVGVCDEFSADLRTGDTLHTHTILHYTASTYNHTHYTPLKDPFLNWKCYNQIVGVWVQMHRNHTGYTSDPLITYLWFRYYWEEQILHPRSHKNLSGLQCCYC